MVSYAAAYHRPSLNNHPRQFCQIIDLPAPITWNQGEGQERAACSYNDNDREFLATCQHKNLHKIGGIHSSRILLALDQTQWDLGWLHVMHCFLICEFIRANRVMMDMHMCRKLNQVEWSSGYHRMLHLKIFTSLMTNRLQVLPSWMGFWICASFLAAQILQYVTKLRTSHTAYFLA